MSRYHFNPSTGEPGQCRAEISCPFGGDEIHFSSADEARAGYEKLQAGATVSTLTRAQVKEQALREKLDADVAAAEAVFAQYQTEGRRGYIEDENRKAWELQQAVKGLPLGSPERQAAVEARNEGLKKLLAADIAFHRGISRQVGQPVDQEVEERMILNARKVIAAHEGLENALADFGGQRSYAHSLRVQPEDVQQVLRSALSEYASPRGRQTSLRELQDEYGFSVRLSRSLRVQPEDVARMLSLAVKYEPAV